MMSLMMSVTAQAAQQISHNVNKDADLYTCTLKEYTLQPYVSDPFYLEVYELVNGQPYKLADYSGTSSPKTYKLEDIPIGEHIYILASKVYQVINSPERAPQPEFAPQRENDLPSSQLPTVSFGSGDPADYYDVYYINVKYHTVEHNYDLYANIYTHQYEFELFTTAGSVDPETGKTFCGLDFKCKINEGSSTDVTGAYIINYDASQVKKVVTLDVGVTTYSVYMVSREGVIQWCDYFYISVRDGFCTSGKVYRKWDDFMFVDNGPGGGNGKYVEYQWYKDGKKINGATKQWYRTSLPQYENAKPSGQYSVFIKDVDGNEIQTCPDYFYNLPASSDVNQHGGSSAPARKQLVNGQLCVEYNGKWYNAQGIEIK